MTLLRQAMELRIHVFGGEYGYGRDKEVDALDHISIPLVLRHREDELWGVMRVIPFPVPEVPPCFYEADRIRTMPVLPGSERSVDDMLAYLCSQQTVQQDERGAIVLSGIKLGRIAIPAPLRGRGIGRTFMALVEAWATSVLQPYAQRYAPQAVYATVQLTAQSVSKGFYEQLGYVATSDEFILLSQPHVWYAKRLPLL
ncbi:acetyltransferase [Malassezia pachydermatis]|uniref:Acetyltransferase n=1 Tax=Malassezia pachydermatis TaxID=77020 RepID=A0A0M8MP71_9BASI|nr:acetyltransferase [Malassezia pachydermatis]KOS14067.1 acetyltransferase [Malassezia pachydermatis]